MKLRWGVLGAARINRSVLPAILASERSQLVALASRDPSRATETVDRFSIGRLHASYDALLADPEVDAVYIPLPNSLHAEWAIRACRAGKHVLCEKPLALSLSEMDALSEAAAASGRVVAEAFMYRHHPQTERVLGLVRDGAVGKLVTLRGAFTFTLDRPGDVRFERALGGGSLWDVGCYPVSFSRVIAGEEPEAVFGWQRTGPSGIDLAFAGLLHFPSGVTASFDCGFDAPLRAETEIIGTEGVLRIPQPFKPGEGEALTLLRGKSLEKVEILPMPGEMLYLGEIADMESAALDGMPQRVSLGESRGNVATLLALLRSAREGQPTRPMLVG